MKKLALALATVAPLALAGTASAKDMKGRFGVGGQLDTGNTDGLSLKYWVSDLGFQGILGYQMVGESGTDTKDNTSEFDLTLRLLYNIARANDTAFGLAGGLISDDAALWRRAALELRAGVLNWNRPTTGASSALPFGGVGLSGDLRPSAAYAADYCAYPVASQIAEKAAPIAAPGLP